jgi:two-component system, NarL family, response regulator LiaR
MVDDHALVRQGVTLFLGKEPDLEIVGAVGTSAEALHLVNEQAPDVVLMDVSLGEESGLELTRRLKLIRPSLRILVVTAHTDDNIVADMLRAGADGYVLKDMAIEELAQAIRAVAAGQFVLHPLVARRWAVLSRQEAPARSETDLTPREVEVLRLMSDGSTSKEIGRHLSLSVKTVENHRANILAKLGARNAAEAISRALDRGLIGGYRQNHVSANRVLSLHKP